MFTLFVVVLRNGSAANMNMYSDKVAQKNFSPFGRIHVFNSIFSMKLFCLWVLVRNGLSLHLFLFDQCAMTIFSVLWVLQRKRVLSNSGTYWVQWASWRWPWAMFTDFAWVWPLPKWPNTRTRLWSIRTWAPYVWPTSPRSPTQQQCIRYVRSFAFSFLSLPIER